jgi:plasmid maintenance system killer protein
MSVELDLTCKEEHRMSVFEKRVLRRIFETNWDEIIGGWRKPLSGRLHNLESSPSTSIIRIIKSGRICISHGDKRNAYGFWWESQKKRGYQEALDVDGRIILK